jgi:hypothetical protein
MTEGVGAWIERPAIVQVVSMATNPERAIQ